MGWPGGVSGAAGGGIYGRGTKNYDHRIWQEFEICLAKNYASSILANLSVTEEEPDASHKDVLHTTLNTLFDIKRVNSSDIPDSLDVSTLPTGKLEDGKDFKQAEVISLIDEEEEVKPVSSSIPCSNASTANCSLFATLKKLFSSSLSVSSSLLMCSILYKYRQ